MTRPRTLLWVVIAAFGAGMASLAVLQHRAFETGRFDVGNLTQAVWSTAHGRFLEVTDLRGDQISRLGSHFDPLVALFAPLWLLWPSPEMLLVVQAICVALGALPVYLLARKHLGSEGSGLAFALVYLLYPPTQWLVLDDFHPVALATPLLLGAIWFLDEDRLLPFALCAGAACLTKEQIGLVVAMLGLWYAVAHGRRRAGTVILVLGLAISAIAIAIVIPHFEPGGTLPFAGRYTAVGGSPGGIVKTALTHPGRLAGTATRHRDLMYLLDLFVPLALLPLLAPLVALSALPELLLNLLSSTPEQTSIHYHYTAGAIPGLIAGAVLAAARIRRRWPRAWSGGSRGLVVAGIVAGILLGPLPVWRHVPYGSKNSTSDGVVTAHDDAAARVLSIIPAAAAVSATNKLGAHLSERRRIFSFPVLREARWVAVDLQRPSYLDDARGLKFAAAFARLLRNPRWHIVRQEDGVIVLHR